MIRQQIDIKGYDWTVYAYYAIDSYYVNEIVTRLKELGASEVYLTKATEHMERNDLNNGLTYSNMATKETVLVVGLTSSPAQFLNSLVHELQHLTSHICEAWSIPMESEEACYLSGSIAQQMYMHVSRLLA